MPSWLKTIFWWLLIGFMLVAAVFAWRWYRASLDQQKRGIKAKRDVAEEKHKLRLTEAQKEESTLLQAIWTEYNHIHARLAAEEKEVDDAIKGGPVELAKFWNDNLLGKS
jgi:hypothetical protein